MLKKIIYFSIKNKVQNIVNKDAHIKVGTVVTKSVLLNALVYGNPAEIIRIV